MSSQYIVSLDAHLILPWVLTCLLSCISLKNPIEIMRFFIIVMIVWMAGIYFGMNSARYGFTSKIQMLPMVLNHSQTPEDKVSHNLSGPNILPPGIVAKESDLYFRRLWGRPDEDLPFKPRYLVTFTVSFDQRDMINTSISKFSNNFTIVLFHYDGRTSEWEQFQWSREVIHISAWKQTKWWFAKRFLHPDVVFPYEYIFIWDEDLDLQHFDAEVYVELVRKHNLEISQPGLNQKRGYTWSITKMKEDSEVHKIIVEPSEYCNDSLKPPCAGFVEIMAPVFSKIAWQCVWYLIQNDLIHGWGLDLAFGRCVEPAHEQMGIVDSQWIIHKGLPSLRSQDQSTTGRSLGQGVKKRCFLEKELFEQRLQKADKKRFGVPPT